MNYFRQKIKYFGQVVTNFFLRTLQPSKITTFAGHKRQAYEKAYEFYNSDKIKLYRNILVFGVLSSYYHSQIVRCIEDEMMFRAKQYIQIKINSMKKEFGTQMASFPEVKCSTRGNWYVIEFTVDQRKCDLYQLLVTALTTFEGKDKDRFIIKNLQSGKEGNALTLQIDFEEKKENQRGSKQKIAYIQIEYLINGKFICHFQTDNKLVIGFIIIIRKLRFFQSQKEVYNKGTISIRGEMIADRPGFKFQLEKTEEISELDIEAVMNVYRTANQPQQYQFINDRMKSSPSQFNNSNTPVKQKSEKDLQKQRSEAINKLEELGVSVFLPEQKRSNLDWDYLAGYEQQKRDIEDTVLLALQYPEIYDKITEATRMKQEPNRPKAVLFEGPPGTGKTTSAKIIAQQVEIPLIYMPLESIMSKFYGEAEKKFADLWEATKMLGKSIIFIDEIDAIAGTRDFDMHEASRRILSTLLRKIDSFESSSEVLLICATNRKQDLDAAMLSRIDMSIRFEKPDQLSRQAIYKRYAKHLDDEQLKYLAQNSDSLSGRNISDICKDAERRWASKLIRKEVDQTVPDLDQYLEALKNRKSQNLA